MRPPLFYGWVVVAVAFVTMGIGVNARTAFSLLFPPILDEFGWERGVTAAAFSIGFLVGALCTPLIGALMDRRGPRLVLPLGVILVAAGLALSPLSSAPWHLYLTQGLLVGGGSLFMGYLSHALLLTNWFTRQRGLAMGLAFSGVGVGSIALLPWVQGVIARAGWRAACWWLAALVLVTLLPLNLLVPRRRPEDLQLRANGDRAPAPGGPAAPSDRRVVDRAWAETDWTLGLALRTPRFWWVALAYFAGLFAWYAVQVHQTKYLVEIGFRPDLAAYALGAVGLCGITGQIAFGYLADRIGREWAFSASASGFVACYAILLLLERYPAAPLLWLMVLVQGLFGHGMSAVYGTIPADLFHGRHYGKIFGTINLAATAGAGIGPWVAGVVHDRTGTYAPAFWAAMAMSAVAATAVWLAAPRKVRAVRPRAGP
jgi:MFS family permease